MASSAKPGRRPLLETAAVGVGVWCLWLAWLRPGLSDVDWAVSVLLLGTLVIVPLGLDLAEASGGRARRLWKVAASLVLPAGLLSVAAFSLPVSAAAAGLAVPWLGVTVLVGLVGLLRAWERGVWPLAELAVDAGLIFLPVGGGWMVLSRLGMRPLDFDPVIVLLTAIHFHYAGFALPIVTGLTARELGPSKIVPAAVVAVVAGVPLVAVGITTTQLGLPPAIESAASGVMTAGGLAAAWLLVRLSFRSGLPGPARVLWGAGAVSLALGMVLAGLYAARFYAPWSLDIPQMRALHGTFNSVLFALPALVAWTWSSRLPPRAQSRGVG